MTISGNYGVTDRLDAQRRALPIVRLTLSGQRVDTYRGQRASSGDRLGDGLRHRRSGSARQIQPGPPRRAAGVAVGGEVRLPTGDEENLLGAGEASVKPRVIAIVGTRALGLHGDVGYCVRRSGDELDYGGALTCRRRAAADVDRRTVWPAARVVRPAGAKRSTPHPRLANVETIRLTSVAQTTDRLLSVVGFKWNVGRTWMVSANVRHPLTTSGLNAAWIPTLTLDYSFQR